MKTSNASMKIAGIKAIKFNGYKIELSVNIKSKPVARMYRILTAGKNKGDAKLVKGFYFNDEARREEWVREQIAEVKKYADAKNNHNQTKSEARANMINPYKVGDLFYDSWGYDQTNIDFYQIVGLKAKSVVLQKIGQTLVNYEGDMCENVKPNPDIKLGEPAVRPIRVRVYNEKVIHSINGYRGSISPYTAGEKGVYQSHYA